MPPNLSSVSLSTLLSHALHLISSLSTPAYFPVPILQCWSTSLPFRDADSGCPGWRSQDLLCAVPPHTAPSSSHRYQYRDHSAVSAAESGPVTLFGSHCLLYSTLFYSLPHSSKCEATLSVSCTAARFIFTSITYLQLIFSPHLSVSLITTSWIAERALPSSVQPISSISPFLNVRICWSFITSYNI